MRARDFQEFPIDLDARRFQSTCLPALAFRVVARNCRTLVDVLRKTGGVVEDLAQASKPSPSQSNRSPFLDVARGVAILGVMTVHTSQHFPTGSNLLDRTFFLGQFGVQLFFVVSAYTMCMVLELRIEHDRRPIMAFLVRRFARLAVPMWVAIAVYQIFLLAGSPHFASTTREPLMILATASLTNGLWPAAFSSVVPGGGSITTEALFYLIFPLLFRFRHRLLPLALICLVCVLLDHAAIRPLTTALFEHLRSDPRDLQQLNQYFHYALPNQLPVFLIGMLLFTLTRKVHRLKPVEITLGVLALIAFALGAKFIAGVAVLSGLFLWLLWRLDVSWSPLVWLGQRSYSLYLFHFAVLNVVFATLPRSSTNLSSFPVALAIVVIATCAIAALSRPLIEEAGISLGRFVVAALRCSGGASAHG